MDSIALEIRAQQAIARTHLVRLLERRRLQLAIVCQPDMAKHASVVWGTIERLDGQIATVQATLKNQGVKDEVTLRMESLIASGLEQEKALRVVMGRKAKERQRAETPVEAPLATYGQPKAYSAGIMR